MKKLFYRQSICMGLGLGIFTIPIALSRVSAIAMPNVSQAFSHSKDSSESKKNNERFFVTGAEPFWNIDVSQKGIVYSWLADGIKKQTFPYVAPQSAEGRPLDMVRVYRLRGRAKSNNMLIIQRVNGYCSDSMSDKQYPYTATLILGNTVRTGCAETR